MSEFEESEFRGPLFNQLEKGNHLLWEPGQVFEKSIGIDRASFSTNQYLWDLYCETGYLNGVILRNRHFRYIWSGTPPGKTLPDFSLNLFIQAKRGYYSKRGKSSLISKGIKGQHWFFEITPHQQIALEKLALDLGDDALVVYASPLFHEQQQLYNHTKNQTIVENSTFPKAIALKGHSKWYYDKPGMSGVANPDFSFVEGPDLFTEIKMKREVKGDMGQNSSKSIEILSERIDKFVDSQSNDFRSTQYIYWIGNIDRYPQLYGGDSPKLKNYLKIETFVALWKLQWLIF
ncbi:MAG: hypothetical protein ACJ77K_19315 [Bacteroidia bacterium]